MIPYPSLRQGLVGAWCPSLGASGGLLVDRGALGAHASWSGTGFRYSPFGVTLTAATTFAVGSLPAFFDFDTTSRFSFSARINFTTGAERTLAFIGPFEFLIGADNTFRVAFGSVFSTNFLRAATPALTPGTDLHVAAVYTGTKTASGVLFWVNGASAATTSQINTLTANTLSASGSRFFNRSTNTNQWLGSADDIRFYNRALTPAEIRLLASSRGIGLKSVGPRISFPQSYPITTPPNRIWSNESGVWTPGSVRANESGSWRNGDVKVNDGGAWITARYHPEAEDWKSRAEAAGGTVSETTLSAVSDFCTAINAAGIRDRMYRLNLFCGGNLAACLTPLYRGPTADGGYGNLYDTNVNFAAGDYQETGASGGLKGNGTNKHLNTGYPANTLAASNTHLGVGVTSDDTLAGTTRTAIGSYNGSANSLEIGLRNATSPSVFFSRFATSTDRMGDNSGAYSLLAKGDLIAAWPQFYRNGVAAGSPATTSQNYPLSHRVAVFANNQANTSVISHTDARLAWYSIGATMTAAQASAFSAAIAAFRTALGRA